MSSDAKTDDELARTATAVGTPATSPPASALGQLGTTLGRYKLERKLGEGGMGVVHAAFDPDLERRIALKVLRGTGDGDDQARQRLLREARAMARLTHANVVTVHEVGSANGRDYVAMELVDGETLADWLRAEKRTPDEIVAAFLAAGRGLAAAHAAGLVHRDFKPHNVLRRRDGRICVTDFGLARETEIGPRASEGAPDTATAGALTVTGAVLGTPAYMAPEQWHGGTIGPAVDQFAFCVALWEALTGERPFRGTTIEQLKAAITRGVGALDASALPRRLRAPLRRGLDPDPAKRWPSMDALLHAITRAERRPRLALVLAATAIVGLAALYIAVGRGGAASAPACQLPARDPAAVLTSQHASQLAAIGRGDLASAIARDLDAWRAEREHACRATPERRGPELACLDGVLARVEAVRRAALQAGGDGSLDAALDGLVAPSVCALPATPRLVLQPTDDTVTALSYLLVAESGNKGKPGMGVVTALADKPGLDACTRAVALRAEVSIEDDVARTKLLTADAITAAEACGDDRLRADVLLDDAPVQAEMPTIGPRGRAALQKAKVAVDRVAQPDLVATLDEQVARVAGQDHHWDEAFRDVDHALAGYTARGRVRAEIGAVLVAADLRFSRNTLADIQAVRASIDKWRPIAEANHLDHMRDSFDRVETFARLFVGDVAGAHEAMVKWYKPDPHPENRTQRLDGTVVDAAGRPVANAEVAVNDPLFVDTIGAMPRFGGLNMRATTTDASGAFAFADAPLHGSLFAQAGGQRAFSVIAPHAKLVLGPTRRLAGKVRLGATSPTSVFVMFMPRGKLAVEVARPMAPLHPDGTFTYEGAPTEALTAIVANWGAAFSANVAITHIPAGTTALDNLVLDAPSSSDRTLDVVARSAVASSLDGAEVFLLPGRFQLKTLHELFAQHRGEVSGMQQKYARPIIGEAIPKDAVGLTQPGDLVAHFTDVVAGDVTACVIGMNGDLSDPAQWRKLQAHEDELEIKCVSAGASDKSIVVEAPPQKRLD